MEVATMLGVARLIIVPPFKLAKFVNE